MTQGWSISGSRGRTGSRDAWARSRALASAGPERLVVSRQRIAESRRLKIRGTYEEACRERDRLKEQFPMPTCPGSAGERVRVDVEPLRRVQGVGTRPVEV
jgi:hypothetical protein